MFLLHYVLDDGTLEAAGMPAAHAQTIRPEAMRLAAKRGCPVRVARHIRGAIRPAYIVYPDGSIRPPGNMRHPNPREECRRSSGTCFCSACRAGRRS